MASAFSSRAPWWARGGDTAVDGDPQLEGLSTGHRTLMHREMTSDLFDGPGEMRERCRAFDWSSTLLGPVEQWPSSLRTIVKTMLASRFPMFLWWGPDLVQIYNDAYRPSFQSGGRDLHALGAKGREFWTDIWHIIGPEVEAVMAGGEATWHENQLVPIVRNGRLEDVWWTYSYGPAFDEDGRVNGVLVVCQETTNDVQMQQQLQSLNRSLEFEQSRLAYVFQQAPSFVAILGESPYIVEMANAAYYQLVGHRELIGRPVFDALPDARGQGFEQLLDNVISTGEPYVGTAVPLVLERTPGAPPEERLLDFVYFPRVEADGRRTGVIVHGVDVTEHVRARRDAEAARNEAEKANRAKSEFLAVMSHELRTPLNAIDGYAEIIELGIRGPVTEEQRGDLTRIRRSQRHLLSLINDVLNYARIEAAAVRYDITAVPLDEILASCDAITAPQRRAKGLSFGHSGCVGVVVKADPERLQQILINLLTNAIKFTEPGGDIGVACRVEQHVAYMTVSDTGRGIPPEQLARIFEPFVQVDSQLTRTNEGIGLGLAISRDLARGMGGDLTAESTLGVGSQLTLTIPMHESQGRTE